MEILNIDNVDASFIWKDEAGLVTKSLGAAAGSQRLYVNLDSVPPKAFSTKYHTHSQQEEFFLILGGCGTLRLNDREYPVRKGDCIAKPAGRNIAHTFYNSGDEPLMILDVGTVEKEDTCYYPDEGVYALRSNGERHVFKPVVSDWTSDPN